jgi:hypothetical protein
MIICKVCKKEKLHKAHGMCNNCYEKTLNKTHICEGCGKVKTIYRAKPKKYCFKCFYLYGLKSVCSGCKKESIIYDKKHHLCKKCYTTPKRICNNCKELVFIKAKGLCAKCYKDSREKLFICCSCGEEKILYAKKMCRKCYYSIRNKKTNCYYCNKLKSINKWIENKPICTKCDITIHHTKKCSICKKIKPLFFKNNTVCRSCYKPPKRKCDICKNINEISRIENNKNICVRCYNNLPDRKTKNIRGDTERLGKNDWLVIMNSTNWKCFYCEAKLNKTNRTVDHIVPLVSKGQSELKNLVPCCCRCNSSKNDRDVFEWAKYENINLSNEQINRLTEAFK